MSTPVCTPSRQSLKPKSLPRPTIWQSRPCFSGLSYSQFSSEVQRLHGSRAIEDLKCRFRLGYDSALGYALEHIFEFSGPLQTNLIDWIREDVEQDPVFFANDVQKQTTKQKAIYEAGWNAAIASLNSRRPTVEVRKLW